MKIGWNQRLWKFCAKFNCRRPHFQNACCCQLETFYIKKILIAWLSKRIQRFRERIVVFTFTSMWLKVWAAFARYLVLPVFPAAATWQWRGVAETFPKGSGFIASYGFCCCCCHRLNLEAAILWSLSSNWISPVVAFLLNSTLTWLSSFLIISQIALHFCLEDKPSGSLRPLQGPWEPSLLPSPHFLHLWLAKSGPSQRFGKKSGDTDMSRTGGEFVVF